MAFLSLDEIESKLTPQERLEIEQLQSARRAGLTADEIYSLVKKQEEMNNNLSHNTISPTLLNDMLGDLL